jgi:hypothetical protein
MKGFKDSTRMKYMDEGVSTRPTDSSGRRMTNEELGMTPGGVDPARKKPMPKAPASGIGGGAMAGAAAGALAGAAVRAAAKAVPRGVGAMSDREMQMLKAAAAAAKKATPKVMSDLERAREMVRPLARKNGGGVPAHSDRPMIRRSKGGLSAMPKGKC